jgi:hypothetical protein
MAAQQHCQAAELDRAVLRWRTRQDRGSVFHIEIGWRALPKTVMAITSSSFQL